ncbi:MAG: phosphate ABC transporter permease PstA [Candidatus Izemoplasmatales bacterium]|jgi:phosphate transport system permease protein|nr:phosphate ABC transporter permease PstA [bacterium]MDZ4196588.1 phosphate ABC transporter permease PstA [Candidatus Izemoplasmatales bacterium]
MFDNLKKRKLSDGFMQALTYLSSTVSLVTLLLIFGFIISKGSSFLNLNLITENYESQGFVADLYAGYELCDCNASGEYLEDGFYSKKWGIALVDSTDLLGKNVVEVLYVHQDSPFQQLHDKGIGTDPIKMKTDYDIIRIAFESHATALSRHGAAQMIEYLNANDSIREIEFQTAGGGIKGSLITTLYLIGLTLLFALPIGVGAAIYLNEYAKPTKSTKIIRSLIETLTGVPSIIYGLMGLAIFVPLTVSLTNATGGNIISGAMTLAVILLPIIIRTTEESLKVVPDEYRQASLALGASKTQTTFQVVLPSAIPGIMTATLLAIGRIVGESAALVFAIGTAIKDDITLTGKSTSLAVHIWAMMTDEPANIELSATIAIIIVLITILLNIIIKIISTRYLKRKLGSAYE